MNSKMQKKVQIIKTSDYFSKKHTKLSLCNDKSEQISYFLIKFSENKCYVLEAWTHPQYRNQGLCRFIFNFLKNLCAERKKSTILGYSIEFKDLWISFGFREGEFTFTESDRTVNCNLAYEIKIESFNTIVENIKK